MKGERMDRQQVATSDDLTSAVFYALRNGCFFPVRRPKRGASVQALIRWGALRHLHDVIARLPKEGR